MKRAIFLIAVIALCVGQSFGPKIFKGPLPSVVAGAAAPYSPTNIAGLAAWWRHYDLNSNILVTNWTDVIQSSVWTNGNNATRPSNSTYGVRFVGDKLMTNATTFGGESTPADLTYVAILRWTTPDNYLCPYLGWGGGNNMFHLMSQSAGNAYIGGDRWGIQAGAASFYDSDAAKIPTNYTILLAIGCEHGVSSYTNRFYTNGIASKVGITTDTLTYKVNRLGADSVGWFFLGDIREILIYTNLVSAANISNLYFLYTLTNYGGDVYAP